MEEFNASDSRKELIDRVLKEAKELYTKKAFEESFDKLLEGLREEPLHPTLLDLAQQVSLALEAHGASELFEGALKSPDNPVVFDQLGSMFLAGSQHVLAQSYLKKALELLPEYTAPRHDLALSYFKTGAKEKAKELLREDPQPDFWNTYLLLRLELFEGHLKRALELIARLPQLMTDPEQKEAQQEIVEQAQKMPSRYALFKSDQPLDLQQWHFILYGGVLLHTRPVDEFNPHPQYTFLSPSYEQIASVLLELQSTLKALQFTPRKVLYPTMEKNAWLLAQVVSRLTGAELQEMDKQSVQNEDTIVVASSSEEIEVDMDLKEVSGRQMTFAFFHNWTAGAFQTPDVIGLFAQQLVFPWEGGMVDFTQEEEDGSSREKELEDWEIVQNILDFIPEDGVIKKAPKWLLTAKPLLNYTGVVRMRPEYSPISPIEGAYFL
ncbi:tetratricopeptide repeat protein [Planobacterium oryzisoli]|uniref:Tetratricopeptide repeat protein n=1 Tax=Planobacterium oryzisoli TaxID=2771435 RepID=A0A930YWK2_9FLAO|nr:tetratricopeptide repeat protein [Planobacterium oryzisoli]MBF5027619.1 hypothetical protein [Planobacterium oryzisoli]